MKATILTGNIMSGKTTWVTNNHQNETIISCDNIRMELTGAPHKFDAFAIYNETRVWEIFDEQLKLESKNKEDIIIDNTNCNLLKFISLKNRLFNLGYDIEVRIIEEDIEVIKSRLKDYPHLILIAEKMDKGLEEVKEYLKDL